MLKSKGALTNRTPTHFSHNYVCHLVSFVITLAVIVGEDLSVRVGDGHSIKHTEQGREGGRGGREFCSLFKVGELEVPDNPLLAPPSPPPPDSLPLPPPPTPCLSCPLRLPASPAPSDSLPLPPPPTHSLEGLGSSWK